MLTELERSACVLNVFVCQPTNFSVSVGIAIRDFERGLTPVEVLENEY